MNILDKIQAICGYDVRWDQSYSNLTELGFSVFHMLDSTENSLDREERVISEVKRELRQAWSQYHTDEAEVIDITANYEGSHITECCKDALERAIPKLLYQRLHRTQMDNNFWYPTFMMEFNGATAKVEPDMSIQDLEKRIIDQMQENQRIYLESDEYKEKQEKNRIQVEALQKEGDDMIESLPALLEEGDRAKILQWWSQLQPISDRSGVKLDNAKIINLFTQKSITPNMNVGKQYQELDDQNVYEYLCGQCLSFLSQEPFALHQVIVTHIEKQLPRFQ